MARKYPYKGVGWEVKKYLSYIVASDVSHKKFFANGDPNLLDIIAGDIEHRVKAKAATYRTSRFGPGVGSHSSYGHIVDHVEKHNSRYRPKNYPGVTVKDRVVVMDHPEAVNFEYGENTLRYDISTGSTVLHPVEGTYAMYNAARETAETIRGIKKSRKPGGRYNRDVRKGE